MGAFSKFKAAKASGGSYSYIQEGNHRLQVISAKIAKDRKNIEFFAVQCRVEETDSDLRSMAPGAVVDWMSKSDKDAYEGNVKQFVCAVFDITEDAVDQMSEEDFEAMMELLVGPAQGCAGRFVDVNVKTVKTGAGNDFNAHRWMPAPEEIQPGYAAEG